MDAIRENGLEADMIYACGPTPMLRALKAYSQEKGILCYLSLEEKMACGIGACLACTCQTKDVDEHSQVHNKRICKDGPVFLAEDIELKSTVKIARIKPDGHVRKQEAGPNYEYECKDRRSGI